MRCSCLSLTDSTGVESPRFIFQWTFYVKTSGQYIYKLKIYLIYLIHLYIRVENIKNLYYFTNVIKIKKIYIRVSSGSDG